MTQLNLQPFAPGTQLRHYKGGLYTVVGSCLIEATLQPGVLYKPQQGDSQDVTWLRPLAAMRDIETEIQANNGIYPFNYGRVTQSELCRRADVKKATLQNPVHKDSTRVEIIKWLDALNANLTQTRDSTRERVTARAEALSDELEHWVKACQAAEQGLAKAEQLIEKLQAENALLLRR